jgi:hypothetical protein
MSKIWKYLNVANHQEISDEIYQYIVDHTDRLLDHHYFVDHSIPHMLRYCPLLTNFLNSRYLMPTRLASIVCSNDAMIPMHRDSDGEHYGRLRIVKAQKTNFGKHLTELENSPVIQMVHCILNFQKIKNTNLLTNLNYHPPWCLIHHAFTVWNLM